MSGVDEQIFECPNCGEIEYWTLKGWDERRECALLLGFLNNSNISVSPSLEVMGPYKEWYRRTLLESIDNIFCDDCKYNIFINVFRRERLLSKIKELWEDRVIV